MYFQLIKVNQLFFVKQIFENTKINFSKVIFNESKLLLLLACLD